MVLEGHLLPMWSGCRWTANRHSPSALQKKMSPHSAPLRTQSPASRFPHPSWTKSQDPTQTQSKILPWCQRQCLSQSSPWSHGKVWTGAWASSIVHPSGSACGLWGQGGKPSLYSCHWGWAMPGLCIILGVNGRGYSLKVIPPMAAGF